ncbi:MAG: MFS transporter [Candidatus Bathyarchaeia archaeon]
MSNSSQLHRLSRVRVLGFPLSGMLCLSMFRISIGLLIPEVSRHFHLGEVEVGLVLSAYLGAMALVMALGGYISDRAGRREAMGSGMAVMASGILLSGISRSFSLLVASIFIAGIGAGVYTPSLYAFMGEALPENRGLLAGITNSAYAFGGFLGPLIFAVLAAGYGWRIPLLIFGALSLASAAAILVTPYTGGKEMGRGKASFKAVIKSKGMIPITSALAIVNVGFVSFTAWTPKFLLDQGLNINAAGLAFGLYSLFGGIGSIVLGWLSDRSGRLRITASTSIIAASLSILYYLDLPGGLPLPAWMAFSALLGFVSFAYWNLSIAAAQDLVDSSVLGSATGFVQDIALITASAAPIISGGLIGLMGISHALMASVGLSYLAHGLIFAAYSCRISAKDKLKKRT